VVKAVIFRTGTSQTKEQRRSGTSAVLDEALADWAEAYGEQTLKDHAVWRP
jgi:hypothetical protein